MPWMLLIVPYGIETPGWSGQRAAAALLIVPYGIETMPAMREDLAAWTFNRTLWN